MTEAFKMTTETVSYETGTKTMDEKTEKLDKFSDSDSDQYAGFDDKATSRLIRKIDWKLIPFLALLYL